MDHLNFDRALQTMMGSFIHAAGLKSAIGLHEPKWKAGQPLKLLLAGYVGTRNTGAEVRVEEMIRQFRSIVGDENLQLTIMTIDKALSAHYFRTVRQITLPQVFPKFLYDECPKHHGVVACEGSMFKSKFADALSTMMAGALGIANTEGKLSIGYGAEAGAMTPPLRRFVEKHCKDSLIICRNEPSQKLLGEMGIRTQGGTDTAWTFDPAPRSEGARLLRDKGWDGKSKILALCPIHPFCWPVKPDLLKAAAFGISGHYRKEHYKSIYFHHHSEESDRKYAAYIRGWAEAVTRFLKKQPVFPILVGMEKLDRAACEDLARQLPSPPPLFISDTYDMYQLVSVLRNSSLLLSSRFHAIVCSMPGQVPSAGVTMDERIRNLMNDRNHPDLFLEVTEKDLGERLYEILKRLDREKEKIADEIGQVIPKQLQLMGEMGIEFLDEVSRIYPDFPRRNLPRTWDAHLPPLPEAVTKIMERYA